MDKAGKKVEKVAKELKKHEAMPMKKAHPMRKGGAVKVRGTGAATKGTLARGPMF